MKKKKYRVMKSFDKGYYVEYFDRNYGSADNINFFGGWRPITNASFWAEKDRYANTYSPINILYVSTIEEAEALTEKFHKKHALDEVVKEIEL